MTILCSALGQQSTSEIADIMKLADLNKDGVIDYAEYDQLMNMQKFNDDQGGNLYVGNAIRFGLLKPDSILNDCVMVSLYHCTVVRFIFAVSVLYAVHVCFEDHKQFLSLTHKHKPR